MSDPTMRRLMRGIERRNAEREADRWVTGDAAAQPALERIAARLAAGAEPAGGSVMTFEDSLDAAWAAAEAALPEGWDLLLWRTMSGDTLGYGIEAHLGRDGLPRAVVFVHGVTLAVALRSLAVRLAARSDPEPGA